MVAVVPSSTLSPIHFPPPAQYGREWEGRKEAPASKWLKEREGVCLPASLLCTECHPLPPQPFVLIANCPSSSQPFAASFPIPVLRSPPSSSSLSMSVPAHAALLLPRPGLLATLTREQVCKLAGGEQKKHGREMGKRAAQCIVYLLAFAH